MYRLDVKKKKKKTNCSCNVRAHGQIAMLLLVSNKLPCFVVNIHAGSDGWGGAGRGCRDCIICMSTPGNTRRTTANTVWVRPWVHYLIMS